MREIPDDTPSLEHPFMDFAASESFESNRDRAWSRFYDRAEKLLGFDLDGNEDADGYSIDGAHAAFETGVTASAYVAEVREAIEKLKKT